MGLGGVLVGATDYCPLSDRYPEIRRVGGTKNARVKDIIELKPDLVILDQEENTKALAQDLESSGLTIWVTFPRTVKQAIADLQEIANIYALEDLTRQVIWLERAVDWLEGSRTSNPIRVFCPVWQEGPDSAPTGWITFNHDTYAHDLLALCGAENIFGGNESARYPSVTLAEVREASPDLILLPSEPFPFSEEDANNINDVLADPKETEKARVHRIDGRLVFWHGTRLGESIRILPELFRPDIGISGA
jgi:ABC-type Fe3+-hydroxamate transport system substrate-binding protein